MAPQLRLRQCWQCWIFVELFQDSTIFRPDMFFGCGDDDLWHQLSWSPGLCSNARTNYWHRCGFHDFDFAQIRDWKKDPKTWETWDATPFGGQIIKVKKEKTFL